MEIKKVTMKYLTPIILFQLLIIWSSTSCKKQDMAKPSSSNPCDNCRVEELFSILKAGGNAAEKLGTFYYDELNRPVFFKAFSMSTDKPDMAFLYDSKGRLTDFIRQYRNGGFETWDSYKYNDSNTNVIDSGYLFGQMKNGRPTGWFSRWVNYLEFDTEGRVSKEYSKNKKGEPVFITTYSYDGNGNRTGYVYDNTVNINRLSPAFQFVNREYSVNNPLGAVGSTNDKGLPLVINTSGSPDGTFLGIYWDVALRSEYYCK